MEIKTIKLLDIQEWRIVKTIRLQKQYGSRFMWADLVYMRSVSKDYCYKVENKTTQDGIVYDIEKTYPSDELDNIILNAVRTEYPDASFRNHELVTDLEVERFKQIFMGQIMDNAIVYLTPERIDLESKSAGTSFIQFRIPIELYIPCKEFQLYFGNEGYFGSYDIDKATDLHLLLEAKTPSLHNLSEILSRKTN